ncbi:phosphotransferase [Metarhizium robertsii ARSEF 23]|nr:phosphotransferase [Metarhizium robertsii ARSEF 23]EFY93995.1 phosphotransferase [Metarhizium robertsii ARSEF 23]
MPPVVFHFIQAQWSSLTAYLSSLRCGLLGRDGTEFGSSDSQLSASEQQNKEGHATSTDTNGRVDQIPSDHYPATEQQIEATIQQFIDSINTDAVCDLASRHNGGKACKIVTKDNGSFNVCFFVQFDAGEETQVVRIPIKPVIRDAWQKVLCEVTTLRYVKDNTTIPVPRVLAYGIHDKVVEGAETPFMIMNLSPGRQLHTKTFLLATKAQRQRLYGDLIDILSQLRKLEFPAGGSLMLNPDDDECNPILGPFLSMTANEFEGSSGRPLRPEVFTSMKRFVDYHYSILTETYRLPVENLSYRDAKTELYALDSLSKEISKCVDSIPHSPSFVLAHPDLRFGNIFVDDDFHILGIIDWEFTGTIPLQLFTPPPWITGHDPDTLRIMRGLVRSPLPGEIFAEFRDVLQKKRETSSISEKLWHEWGFQQGQAGPGEALIQVLPPIAQILRHPSSLMSVYYSSIFRKLFGPLANRDAEIHKFFDHPDNLSLAKQVELQIEKSKRYTQFLEGRGLLVEDVQSQQIREYLANTEHLVHR